MKIPTGFHIDRRRTSASVARLLQIKDVTPDDAERIRLLWVARDHASVELVYPESKAVLGNPLISTLRRECVNRILRTYGVEYLGDMRGSGHPVYYCNAGDPYATTVLFIGDHMRVGCTGDLIENNRTTQPVQL